MKIIRLAALATTASLALLLAACGSADTAESIAAIRHNEQGQLDSIAGKDLVGAVRLYRDDAKLVRPDGSVLDGGEAIAQAYGDLLEDPNFKLTIEPRDGWASSDGDLAVVTSAVSMTTTDAATGEVVTTPLNSQTVWTRESGAGWKIVSAYNVPAEPAAAPPAAAEAEAAPAE
jgi:ketosteroid isomerase-like protein